MIHADGAPDMAKSDAKLDVLVIGSHPCADLAAALLRQNSPHSTPLNVTRVEIASEVLDERLVYFNAELFALNPLLESLRSKLDLSPIHGLKFLADDAQIRSEHNCKSVAGFVTPMKSFRAAVQKLAPKTDCKRIVSDSFRVNYLDETGVEIKLDSATLKPKLLIVTGDLPPDARRALGIPLAWDQDVLHRYCYVKCKSSPRLTLAGNANAGEANIALMPMSLDLRGKLTWGWALQAAGFVQFAVEQPASHTETSVELLAHWIKILASHGMIKDADAVDLEAAITLELPLAGALAQEDVGNRTLLIGPAGGFYSACAEDIYPACWSAVFAADAARKALKEKHLQDALLAHRHKWGATLGDYLRGPQQNLRFLLSLVYKNKVMTARLAEAILFGKSVVR